MFELAVIVGVVIAIIFVVLWQLWRWIFGGQIAQLIIKMFNIAHERDMRVDPEADIVPSEREAISDVMQQHAEQVKQQTAIAHPANNVQQAIPQASIPATESSQKPIYEPPYTQNAATIEPVETQNQQTYNNSVMHPPAPLVEDQTFEADDPIIDDQHIDPETPSADTLDAHIPDLDSSPYGVRSADHSPGRRLRDKRYRRNSS